jgi:N-acetylmuramoyl-L-alanine amidase
MPQKPNHRKQGSAETSVFSGLPMNKNFLYGSLSLLAWSCFFLSCVRNTYASANREHKKQVKQFSRQLKKLPLKDSFETGQWVGTTNFNMRKPNFVVIHHTAQNSCAQTLSTFTTKRTQVSAHYVICKDGLIHHMLHDYLRAWHGGVGKWGNNTDLNSSSIGIEIDNNGIDSFSTLQIASLMQLLGHLKRAHGIPTANFIGHSDIAPTRKVDPNVHFPWKQLSDSGYGLWWSDTTGVSVPAEFNHLQGLRIIGYDIRDSVAAISAFKRKFLQVDKSSELTEADRKVLYSLYRKYE